MAKTITTQESSTASIQVVTPVYGEFVPTSILTSVYNTSAGSIVPGSAPASSEGVANGDGVIHDITGTTVYVVAVICVIPVAGLVAWVVRYVVKKKVTKKICQYGDAGDRTRGLSHAKRTRYHCATSPD